MVFQSDDGRGAKNKEPSLAQIEYDETLCEENIETYTPIEELIRNLEITCKINERANDDDVHHLIEKIIPETKTQKCFAACWMEKLQIIKKGKLKLDRYAEASSYDYRMDFKKIAQLKELLTECKYVDSGNPERCDLAYKIITCIHNAATRRGLNVWDF